MYPRLVYHLMYTRLFWNAPTAACSCALLLYIRLLCHDIYVSFDIHTSLLKHTHNRMLAGVIALYCSIYVSFATTFVSLFWHTHISFDTYPQPHARACYCSISPPCLFECIYVSFATTFMSLLTYTHLFWHIPAAACSCRIHSILATTPSASTTLYSACLFSCIYVSFIRLFWRAHVPLYTYPQLHARE